MKFSWTMNGQQVSSDSVYMFIAANMGNYKIDVKATDGKEETTVSASVEVYGKYKYGTFISVSYTHLKNDSPRLSGR